jgi:glycosyltransferase involved in cell wall biosynthesis
MKILHVVPSLSLRIGGPAVSVVGSAHALRDLGVESTVLTTDMAEAVSSKRRRRVMPADLPPGADSLDVRILPARAPYRLAFSPGLQREVDRIAPRYDVVHIHMLFMHPQFAAYRAARRHGVPYIVSPCGALDPHLRSRSRVVKAVTDRVWQRDMLDGAAALHFKSEAEAALVADMRLGPPHVVVPNGVEWSIYQRLPPPGEFLRKWSGGSKGPIVLSLGRLSHKKGLDVLIRAFAMVARQHEGARLVLAGPDDEDLAPSLRALATAEGVGASVVFSGMLAGVDKLAALAAADVWALPSHTENFGVAVVEAMAAGLPVVISPQVNIAHDVALAGAGVVCERTPRAFATEISALLCDSARRHALADRARSFARRYEWSAVAPQMVAMYERVIAGARDLQHMEARLAA